MAKLQYLLYAGDDKSLLVVLLALDCRQRRRRSPLFASYEAILDACRHAWCSLTAEAGRIAYIGTRDWAIVRQSL
jgi:hypothetical protein